MDFVNNEENHTADHLKAQSEYCMVCNNELSSWEEKEISICDHCVSKAIGD
ncbi:hypothetical protein SAMN04488137_2730 [Fictibacillus solisalsi]|uniref:Uncharacterized protein n=1 Tax=Fictibacillus solisalsi TaxID=459525 RepID=A0A1G9XDG4_9BACL|nr:hypothetical protein [Fictibacillus solisalsi]SDM94832.1 hypothetical protein SAMN04488137_2730 [Fictibacillus solisalsi]